MHRKRFNNPVQVLRVLRVLQAQQTDAANESRMVTTRTDTRPPNSEKHQPGWPSGSSICWMRKYLMGCVPYYYVAGQSQPQAVIYQPRATGRVCVFAYEAGNTLRTKYVRRLPAIIRPPAELRLATQMTMTPRADDDSTRQRRICDEYYCNTATKPAY